MSPHLMLTVLGWYCCTSVLKIIELPRLARGQLGANFSRILRTFAPAILLLLLTVSVQCSVFMQVWNWFNCSSENFNFVSEEALSQQQHRSKDWERRDFPCSQLDYYRIHLVSLILVLSFFSQNLEGIHCNLPLCKSNSSEPEQWANHKDVKSSLKAKHPARGQRISLCSSLPGQELSPVDGDVGSLLHARVTQGFTISTKYHNAPIWRESWLLGVWLIGPTLFRPEAKPFGLRIF